MLWWALVGLRAVPFLFWLRGLTSTPEDRLHSSRGGVFAGGLRKATSEAFGAAVGAAGAGSCAIAWSEKWLAEKVN